MEKTEKSPDGIDWSLTTWEGSRREQLRRWSEMPLEDQIRAIEDGMKLMEHFRRMADLRKGDGRETT